MNLHVINSNSLGNSYLLEAERETLIIDMGVNFKHIKKALRYNLNKVAAALLSHSHRDHSLSAQAIMNAGIDVYGHPETFKALNLTGHRCRQINAGIVIKIGGFKVKPFPVKHDVPCYGYLIDHSESGLICFITDTYYVEYTFRGVSHFIVETNFGKQIIADKMAEGLTQKFRRDRILQSHFSMEDCRDFLIANDLSGVKTITLIHLSDSHSDEAMFKHEVEKATGKQVNVANAGLTFNLSKQPF